MRLAAAAALAAALLMSAGCEAVLKFHECDKDSDCGPGGDGGMLYCSDDHMCVGAIPDYQLCALSVPRDTGGKIPDGALVVGGLFRTSGPNDVNDHTFRQAADLAAQDFVDAHYNLALVVCDTAADRDQAVRAYSVVIQRFGAKVIVGPDTSSEVFALNDPMRGSVVTTLGVPIISPSASNPDITGLADDNLVWRTCASDNLQAKVLATLAPATMSTKLDILFESDNDYAKGLRTAFLAAYSALGGMPQPAQGYASDDQTALMAAVATMAADHPAYALLIADTSMPPLMAAVAGASGLSTTQFLMTDSAKKAPSLWSQLGTNFSVLSRVHGTGPANPDPSTPSGAAFAAFANTYKSANPMDDPAQTAFVNNTYDAFYVAAIAALALPADKRTPANIVANLGRLSDQNGPTVVVGPNDLNSGVTGVQNGTINLVGTSGPIDFDDKGDVVSAPIEKWSVNVPDGGMPVFKTDEIITPAP